MKSILTKTVDYRSQNDKFDWKKKVVRKILATNGFLESSITTDCDQRLTEHALRFRTLTFHECNGTKNIGSITINDVTILDHFVHQKVNIL